MKYPFFPIWTSHEQKNKMTKLGLFLGKESNYQLPAKNEPQKSTEWTSIKKQQQQLWGEKLCKELKQNVSSRFLGSQDFGSQTS